MINKKLILLMFGVLILIVLPAISAADGCCIAPEDGLCTKNADEANCEAEDGVFYDSANCGISQCQKGCCTLGIANIFSTERTCVVQSRAKGFEINFQYTDEQGCADIGRAQETGACVYEQDFENTCVFTTFGECGGEFYQDTLCSASELDTICEKTTKTTCFDKGEGEDVYFKDSCGNPDQLKTSCDYASGSICKQEGANRAICKNLNCAGGKKNGEKWCINENPNKVGSRSFSQYCLNGEIFTEPCADFRMETCSAGGKCEINPGLQCLAANTEEGVDEESCGAGCKLWSPGESEGDRCYTHVSPEWEIRACNIGGTWYEEGLTSKLEGDGNFKEKTNFNSDNLYPGTSLKDYSGEIPDIQGTDNTEESSGDLIKYLKLDLCVPEIPIGLQFYPKIEEAAPAGASTKKEDHCAKGDFSSKIEFVSITKVWYFQLDKGKSNYFGNLFLIDSSIDSWGDYEDSDRELSGIAGNRFIGISLTSGPFNFGSVGGIIGEVYSGNRDNIPLNPEVILLLNERCEAIGDCLGKQNWIGSDGVTINHGIECDGEGEEMECEAPLVTEAGNRPEGNFVLGFDFEYKCKSYKAPPNAQDCGKCGADGLPCSEYRCKALGQACEYFQPAGVDKGYCAASSDISSPKITSKTLNPEGSIPAFSPVEITITTDELSMCKFNLGTSGEDYQGMAYEFGGTEGYALTHKIKLNVPGIVDEEESGAIKKYNLITDDGKYDLHVRCQDVAGNFNIASEVIQFEVDPKPDTTAPFISEFFPESGSAVRYNETTQDIGFLLNEPVECKWDLEDKEYESMDNDFLCDGVPSDNGLIYGYGCVGTLEDVKRTGETKYYIRCEDQPWLEGNETILYKRNTNSQSVEYNLIASPSELEILELTPTGDILRSGADLALTLNVITSGGGYNGKSTCRWRLFNDTSFVEFANTDSSTHSQETSSLEEGEYNLEVICVDAAGNSVQDNSKFELEIDSSAPRVARAYNENGLLKIITTEDAQCKFVTDSSVKCNFEFDDDNVDKMEGSAKEHTATWEKGTKYYIKCEDYRENINPGCGIIVRTY